MLGPSSWVPAAWTSCSLIAAVRFPGGAAAAKAGFLRAGRTRRYLAQGTALIGGKLTGPYITYFDRNNSLSHRRGAPPAPRRGGGAPSPRPRAAPRTPRARAS